MEKQMNDLVRAALEQVLEHYLADEKRHFEEAGKPQNHIFASLQIVATWLDEAGDG